MNETFSLHDTESVSDLQVYVSRAKRVDENAVRVLATGGVLAVYAAVLYQRGLLDQSPTVLGLRTFAETSGANFDRVVAPGAIAERLARLHEGETAVVLPPTGAAAPWAGIAPPRGGWARAGMLSSIDLEVSARRGADAIRDALPENAGDHVVQKLRSSVWSQPISEVSAVPAGAAFAAVSLGFIVQPEDIPVYENGQWLRLSAQRGHVLVRRRG